MRNILIMDEFISDLAILGSEIELFSIQYSDGIIPYEQFTPEWWDTQWDTTPKPINTDVLNEDLIAIEIVDTNDKIFLSRFKSFCLYYKINGTEKMAFYIHTDVVDLSSDSRNILYLDLSRYVINCKFKYNTLSPFLRHLHKLIDIDLNKNTGINTSYKSADVIQKLRTLLDSNTIIEVPDVNIPSGTLYISNGNVVQSGLPGVAIFDRQFRLLTLSDPILSDQYASENSREIWSFGTMGDYKIRLMGRDLTEGSVEDTSQLNILVANTPLSGTTRELHHITFDDLVSIIRPIMMVECTDTSPAVAVDVKDKTEVVIELLSSSSLTVTVAITGGPSNQFPASITLSSTGIGGARSFAHHCEDARTLTITVTGLDNNSTVRVSSKDYPTPSV